ncbi:MAG: PAS domain-containing protein [Undibacterium umbellatum]|uniref:PAS domain-containing protein n=1 Tax=Undibacterium umbellatum TaxID=2762300 RepID=UPI003BB60061
MAADSETIRQLKLAETFFNHSVSCLVILDREYNFVRVNQAYADACRRDIAEFEGRNHFEFFPSDAQLIFDEVVRTKRPFITFLHAPLSLLINLSAELPIGTGLWYRC